MPRIGTYDCRFVHGSPGHRGLKSRVTLWQTIGFAGHGAHVTAWGDSSFNYTGVVFGTLDDVNAWARNIELLQGQVVTIINDHGDVIAGCLIARVGTFRRRAAVEPGAPINQKRGELSVEGVIV